VTTLSGGSVVIGSRWGLWPLGGQPREEQDSHRVGDEIGVGRRSARREALCVLLDSGDQKDQQRAQAREWERRGEAAEAERSVEQAAEEADQYRVDEQIDVREIRQRVGQDAQVGARADKGRRG